MKLSDEEQRGIWKNRLSFNTICYLYGISCVFRFYLNLSHVIFYSCGSGIFIVEIYGKAYTLNKWQWCECVKLIAKKILSTHLMLFNK